MASATQGHPSFPPRSGFATSTKLPDRTGLSTGPPPFGQSLSRRPPEQSQYATQPNQFSGQPAPFSQPAPQPPQHGQQGRPQDSNPLNELTEEQREEINEAFSLFDLDRDRHLDWHELRCGLRALGFTVPKPELVAILSHAGVPRASLHAQYRPPRHPENISPSHLLISQADFARLAAQRIIDRDPREEVDRAFDLFDLDRKGLINFNDLKRVAGELGETGLEEEELQAMIDEFDLLGHGGVDREAFVGICLQG